MNTRSLSTFDSSVSCLYFFESEYAKLSPTQLCLTLKSVMRIFRLRFRRTANLIDDVKKQQ